jgi:hypothetical protein
LLGDLEKSIPTSRLLRPANPDETLEVPTSHLLAHIVPTVSLRLIAESYPDFVEPTDELIRIPAAKLATTYRLQEITGDFEPAPPASESLLGNEIPSPVANLGNLAEAKAEALSLPDTDTPPTETADTLEHSPSTPGSQLEPPSSESPKKLAELLNSLPTFRRITHEQPGALVPITASDLVIDIPDAESSGDIPDQQALQSLFLTEEKLTIDRVVELCGTLPGIRSCVLTRDEMVVSSHNVPENVDLISLSSNASAMLDSMQAASLGMGVGDIPALTLHTSRGPLSIVRSDRLTMLVFHAERGFIPGVREKMAAALGELSRAPLCLTSGTTPD